MGVDEDFDVEGEEEMKDWVRHSISEGIHEWEREWERDRDWKDMESNWFSI